MRIAFHSNQIGLRGSEIALYDYADYNEKLLGNNSFIITKKKHSWPHIENVVKKFQDRFNHRIFFYDGMDDLERQLDKNKIDIFYVIKGGSLDGVLSKNRKNVVHSVFQCFEPHGNVYAYISDWLSIKMTGGKYPFVPHVVNLEKNSLNMRSQLGIPSDAMVFGRHGGLETFDLNFVKRAIEDTVNRRKDIYFLFVYTDKFYTHPQIIHIDSIFDPIEKIKFINSCDAMIHARSGGESFGLAIAEFSFLNKPVLTWDGGVDQAHLHFLGDKGIKYKDYNSVFYLLNNFKPDRSINYDCYSQKFSPEIVMNKFNDVFIKEVV
jgi:hypothetical protein